MLRYHRLQFEHPLSEESPIKIRGLTGGSILLHAFMRVDIRTMTLHDHIKKINLQKTASHTQELVISLAHAK